MVSRQVEGRFPNYNLILPQPQPEYTKIDPAPLIQSIVRAALVSDQETKAVMINGRKGATTIEFSGNTSRGKSQTVCSGLADSLTSNIKAKINPVYLTDALRQHNSPVELHYYDESRPLMLLSLHGDNKLTTLVMPLA